MAQRLRMTNADYLAIAISPALIMLLVGSLVFFLIEVAYAGEYQARLSYVFGLFVFATVLVARIAIESGGERAALYSVPLGLATFVVLLRFVEFSSPLSPLFNLLLIAIVWWCAHKLTWDCTMIDDSVDASGEGLMERLGIDQADLPETTTTTPIKPAVDGPTRPDFANRHFSTESKPHSPGTWVVYFSLAALPLFGIGQALIPVAETGRRRYAFMLLVVYVAAGLLLLMTTSFLSIRRYLRQREIEMPSQMVATWVGLGCGIAAMVLLIAMLLPRPLAEFAIAQPPWRATSPGGLESSQFGRGNDGTRDPTEMNDGSSTAASKDDPQAPMGNATSDEATGRPAGEPSNNGNQSTSTAESKESKESGQSTTNNGGSESARQPPDNAPPSEDASPENSDSANRNEDNKENESSASADTTSSESRAKEQSGSSASESPSQPAEPTPQSPQQTSSQRSFDLAQVVQNTLGGLGNAIKWLFYLALAIVGGYLLWKYRRELLTAARDLLGELRGWLGRLWGSSDDRVRQADAPTNRGASSRKRFRDFQNPFANDGAQAMQPDELVRFTFDALEAWAADRGTLRRVDQTPQEFVDGATNDDDSLHREACHLARLYSRIAYGAGHASPDEAIRLRQIWDHLQDAIETNAIR